MTKYECWNLIIQTAILITLAATAIFVIKYWRETQDMKNRMVKQNRMMMEQNRLLSESVKGSYVPIIDLLIEPVRPDEAAPKIGGS